MKIKYLKTGMIATVTRVLGLSMIADGIAVDAEHEPDPEDQQVRAALGIAREEEE